MNGEPEQVFSLRITKPRLFLASMLVLSESLERFGGAKAADAGSSPSIQSSVT